MIPCTISDNDPTVQLSPIVIQTIHNLKYFVVENSKTARRFIKLTKHPLPQNDLNVIQIDKHQPGNGLDQHLEALRNGTDIGFISEAGMPGIADPGSLLAMKAHQMGITVKSLAGPNSILMALAASGLNGQDFCFHGYLPRDKQACKTKIKELQLNSRSKDQTQIFIETPYRNNSLFENLVQSCDADTTLCIASNLSGEDEMVGVYNISDWKKNKPELNKKPTVFLLYAGKKEVLT